MLSNKIKSIMVEKKISQSELARRLGVNRQTVYGQLKFWEKGGIPKIKSIYTWSKALDVPVGTLFHEISSK
ncbi:MAG: helix-turn-helix transcriptional regulator [Fusobacteriaceae bacterium]